jgi:hypothetical protein
MNKYAAKHEVIAALLPAFCFGEQKKEPPQSKRFSYD